MDTLSCLLLVHTGEWVLVENIRGMTNCLELWRDRDRPNKEPNFGVGPRVRKGDFKLLTEEQAVDWLLSHDMDLPDDLRRHLSFNAGPARIVHSKENPDQWFTIKPQSQAWNLKPTVSGCWDWLEERYDYQVNRTLFRQPEGLWVLTENWVHMGTGMPHDEDYQILSDTEAAELLLKNGCEVPADVAHLVEHRHLRAEPKQPDEPLPDPDVCVNAGDGKATVMPSAARETTATSGQEPLPQEPHPVRIAPDQPPVPVYIVSAPGVEPPPPPPKEPPAPRESQTPPATLDDLPLRHSTLLKKENWDLSEAGKASYKGSPSFPLKKTQRKLLARLVEALPGPVHKHHLKDAAGNSEMNDETLVSHLSRLRQHLKDHLKAHLEMPENPIPYEYPDSYRLDLP
jgi:hypothetical protein